MNRAADLPHFLSLRDRKPFADSRLGLLQHEITSIYRAMSANS